MVRVVKAATMTPKEVRTKVSEFIRRFLVKRRRPRRRVGCFVGLTAPLDWTSTPGSP